MARYIFVTGGVVSSLGKGLSSASLGYLLKSQGYKVRIRKMDPYLNVDPGTMSPFQHGEVFVTDDGAETDLDLGHYERFTDISSKQSDNITTGRVYRDIIKKERKGKYLGKTVQVIPHVTDRIREFKGDVKRNDIVYVHVTLLPYIGTSGEIKTKPTQHSVKELRSIGIQPDILVCRSDRPINDDLKNKIGGFCGVNSDAVIASLDADSIYSVPLALKDEGLCKEVLDCLNLNGTIMANLLSLDKTKTQ